MHKKCKGMGLNGFMSKKLYQKNYIKEKKKIEPFRICLLNSTAIPVQFGWKLAPFFRYETLETHAPAFFMHIILPLGGVIIVLQL